MMATPGKDSKAFEEMVGNLKNAVVKEKKKFGKEVKEDFMFAEGYVNANHGAFLKTNSPFCSLLPKTLRLFAWLPI